MSAGVERATGPAVADVLETEEARNLLEAAQAAGSVSQDDIALALDELELDAGQIDEFYKALEEMQVEVVAASTRSRRKSPSPRRARSRRTRCSSS